MPNRYYMTLSILRRLKSFKGHDILCDRCCKPFEAGDEIISTYNRYKRHFYHRRCYDKMWLDTS